MDDAIEVEDMSHEPLGFLSGYFRGSQLRWATVDKEGYAIISTFRRLEYLLWSGVHIHTDHRNLAYIFDPEACVSSVPKTLRRSVWSTGRQYLDSTTIQFDTLPVNAIAGGGYCRDG